MPDLTQLLGHWGYVALFVVVMLGNVGVPLPEETVLALAGYLVWRGDMQLPVVLVVGVVSAVAGCGPAPARPAWPVVVLRACGEADRTRFLIAFNRRAPLSRGPLARVPAPQ